MKLVVIPSDPISEYEKKGTSSWLKMYYNPNGYFEEVFVLSPLEKITCQKYGLTIIPIQSKKQYHKMLEEIQPDVIRAYGGYWAAEYAVSHRNRNIPVIVSVHDTNPDLLYKAVKYADHIICMTNAVRNLVCTSLNIEKSKTSILGNRVNTNQFKELNTAAVKEVRQIISGKDKFILHIGRKTHQKNIDTLIHALKYLPENYKIIFVGQGNSEPYQVLASELGVGKNCIWIPKVENSKLPYWYNACDLFCVPSRWEGFGVVFIEAAACKCLMLTSNIAPMNEIFLKDEAILIDNYENPKEVADSILFAMSLKKEAKEKIVNAAQAKAENFDVKKIASNEVNIYKTVIQKYIPWRSNFSFYLWKTGADIRLFSDRFNSQASKLIRKLIRVQKRIVSIAS